MIQFIGAVMFLSVFFIILSGIQNVYYSLIRLFIGVKRIQYKRKREILSEYKLNQMVQRPLVIYIASWKEQSIIGEMLTRLVENQKYSNYTIFVGTYPNDLETQKAVDAVSNKYHNVVKVIADRPGPTTKSHNLNNVYRAMINYEKEKGCHFEGVMIHDSEDAVNPYELLIFNYFILRMDAVQFPILPMPVEHREWIHWLYGDEFAVYQYRDSVVREFTSGFVAFAGVGMGLPRRTLKKLEDLQEHNIFPENSLTEDYLMSAKLAKVGVKISYLCITLSPSPNQKKKYGRASSYAFTPLSRNPLFVSNWSYFPKKYGRSIRQKTRWITGIVFQSAKEVGWSKRTRLNESFIKDRRIFFDYVFLMLSTIILIYNIILFYTEIPILNIYDYYPNLLLLYKVAMIFVIEFIISRFICIWRVYGFLPAVLSLPRLIFGIIFNIHLIARSFYMHYYKKNNSWDKTAHDEGVGHINVQEYNDQNINEVAEHHDNIESQECFINTVNKLAVSERYEDRGLVPIKIKKRFLEGELQVTDTVTNLLIKLLKDASWVVRNNAVDALTTILDMEKQLTIQSDLKDEYAKEILSRAIKDSNK